MLRRVLAELRRDKVVEPFGVLAEQVDFGRVGAELRGPRRDLVHFVLCGGVLGRVRPLRMIGDVDRPPMRLGLGVHQAEFAADVSELLG